MRLPGRVVSSLGGILIAAATATAADPPCVAEVRKLCANVPAGGGRIQGCLKEHEAELSAPCRARVDDLKKEMGSMAATCHYDVMRLCDHVTPGAGRVVGCLEEHKDDLSPECKDRLATGK